eukprot:8908389-Alexandrium_andersonii.AAC.1
MRHDRAPHRQRTHRDTRWPGRPGQARALASLYRERGPRDAAGPTLQGQESRSCPVPATMGSHG